MFFLHKSLNIQPFWKMSEYMMSVSLQFCLAANTWSCVRYLLFSKISNTPTFWYLESLSFVYSWAFFYWNLWVQHKYDLFSKPTWTPSFGLDVLLMTLYYNIIILYYIIIHQYSYINVQSIWQTFWSLRLSSSLHSKYLRGNRNSITICCLIEWTNLLIRYNI